MATNSAFSSIITEFRNRGGASQEEVAALLGVSQATVSRILRGLLIPSEELAIKIRDLGKIGDSAQSERLIKRQFSEQKGFLSETVKSAKAKDITLSYFLLSGSPTSGDVCTFSKITKDKIAFMLADAVGSGSGSNPMAFALDFGFHTITQTLNPAILDPKLVTTIMQNTVSGKQDWLGMPALSVGVVDGTLSEYRVSNAGLPVPLLFSGNEVKPLTDSRVKANGQSDAEREPRQGRRALGKGDALLMVTDGFFELLGATGEEDAGIRERFGKAARILRGDADAILQNLREFITHRANEEPREALDDVSALVIARRK